MACGLLAWSSLALSAGAKASAAATTLPSDAGIQEAVGSQMTQLVRSSVLEFFAKAKLPKPERIDVATHVDFAMAAGHPVISLLKLDVMLNTEQPPSTVREARQAVLRTLRGNGYRTEATAEADASRPQAVLTVGVDPASARAGHNGWRQYGAFAALAFAALAFLALLLYLLALPLKALGSGRPVAARPGDRRDPLPPPIDDPGLSVGLPALPGSGFSARPAALPARPSLGEPVPGTPPASPHPGSGAPGPRPAPQRLPAIFAPSPTPPAPAAVPAAKAAAPKAAAPTVSARSADGHAPSAATSLESLRRAIAERHAQAAAAPAPPTSASRAAGARTAGARAPAAGANTSGPGATSTRAPGTPTLPRPANAAAGSPGSPDPLDPRRVSQASPQALRQAFNRLPFEKALALLARLDPAARQSVLAKLELQEAVRSRLERELAALPGRTVD